MAATKLHSVVILTKAPFLLFISMGIFGGKAHVCNVSYVAEYGGLFADCNGRQLREVPMDLPTDIVGMDLSKNDIGHLKNKTFLRYSGLKYLYSHHSHIHGIEPDAFSGLSNLSVLSLASNRLGIEGSLLCLKPLVGNNLSSLDLSRNEKSNSVSLTEISIKKKYTKYLTQMCIGKFNFQHNLLFYIDRGALTTGRFAECLKVLDISANNIYGDMLGFVLDLVHVSNLMVFNVGNLNTALSDDKYLNNLMNAPKTPSSLTYPLYNSTIRVFLPATMMHLDLSGFVKIGGDTTFVIVEFENGLNVLTLSYKYNRLSSKDRGLIRGLNNTRELDLSGTTLAYAPTSFFQPFNKVRKLYVKNCKLRSVADITLLFKPLQNIELLDFSQNYAPDFPLLQNPTVIKTLILSDNSFQNLPFDLNLYSNLSVLDLSFNLISHIDPDIRSQLDAAYQQRGLNLHLKGNVFSCGCQNLDLIVWLTESPVIAVQDRNYSCILDDGSLTGTEEVARHLVSAIRHCQGRSILILTVCFISIAMTTMVAIYVIAKNPTRYRNLMLKCLGFKAFYQTPEDFPFKYYIGYTEADLEWVFRKLRPAMELCHAPVQLFLKDREVLPGVDIADGIVEGVTNSWKTILLVSREFMEDIWSTFTISTAICAMGNHIPDRIVVLLAGDVGMSDLPETLLNAVNEDFIFQLDDFVDQERDLWNRFRHMK